MTATSLRLASSGQLVTLRDTGTGEPLVLIHGVGLQSAAWGPQIAALGQSRRIIAVDMPGHGGSDPLPQNSALPDFVAWCHEVVQTLGLGPVNLAGHSMGALIAGGFAVTHPDLTRRVALVNGVYRRTADARAAVRARAAEIRAGQVDLQTPLDRWFGGTPVEQAARKIVSDWLEQVDRSAYATAYSAFADGDETYAAGYSDIACPFLALTGADDPNSTPAMAEAMAATVRNGQAVSIAGHRHMVNLTAPDVVTAHLADWLARHGAF